jgi:glucosamine--fructose-6-phosphate aminotransferase (isomerizing)
MCSVVGYVGQRQSCSLVLDGLSRLEYRGYDSSGFACIDEQSHLVCAKSVGKLSNLVHMLQEKPIDGTVGIGHTRWSTHGIPSEKNAHPHFDCHKKVSVVHNGIIENYQLLKKDLEFQGHVFSSDTDTEVIAHLFEQEWAHAGSLKQAVLRTVHQLEGAYACVLLCENEPGRLVGIRKSSPLCVGRGKNEFFIASDVLAFAGQVEEVAFLPQETFAFVTSDTVNAYDFSGNVVSLTFEKLDALWIAAEKEGHEHFMLKEIYEQKNAIYKTATLCSSLGTSFWEKSGISSEAMKAIKRIKIIGCGTSWHAGRIAEFFFEETTKLPTTAALASEFRYRTFFPESDTLYIAISQSGETADTLEAVRMLRQQGQHTLALTNVASSTLVRECEGFFLTQAGPEMAVASTKAFTTQIAALYWLSNRMGYERGIINEEGLAHAQDMLLVAGELLENGIDIYKHQIFEKLAPFYAQFDTFIFLGRHISYPFALEAALKLKEIAYIFSQAYPAGELKHGPLALVDDQTPVCIFSHPDPAIYQKILSNAQEVASRKGHILSFSFEGQKELQHLSQTSFVFPVIHSHLSVIAMTGVMQIFMYAIAKTRGCEIDRPRNLAKSVTVE